MKHASKLSEKIATNGLGNLEKKFERLEKWPNMIREASNFGLRGLQMTGKGLRGLQRKSWECPNSKC